jgi:glycosyltransferase involved in cell wall biosynthesis
MADSLLVNGPSLLKFYRLGGDFRGKVFFYFPPVDSDVFRPVSSEERIRSKMNWGYPADTRLVGTVANITPQKGIDLFANMVAEVHHRRPDVRFMVVGGPTAAHQAYYHRVLSHAAELGLSEETLRFVGARADVQDIVPMWDVKVIASRAEGTTATAGEALACGVPVIARDVGAICDVVEHGLTGLLVSTESPLALSTAVLQLLDDPGSRHSMGLNGRMRALESFSTFQCARTHRSAYESAILHRSRRRSVPHNNQGERL